MISNIDKEKIVALAKKYKVSRILIFGSSALPERESNDIDIAVAGLPPSKFFTFYGELLFSLSKPVDVVDLENKSRFSGMIAAEGIPLYG